MRRSPLLLTDGIINLALGVLLMVFPEGIVTALGIPPAEVGFYPSILGAVLFGIGIALFLQIRGNGQGLGLRGAIAINVSGGIVLALWLLFGNLVLPLRGQIILWVLVVVLVGLSTLELVGSRNR